MLEVRGGKGRVRDKYNGGGVWVQSGEESAACLPG